MSTPITPPAGYVAIPLPSRGLLYGDLLPDGQVFIRKLRVQEETALQSAATGNDLVNATIPTACKLPAGLNHLDLLMVDRLAILIALRVHTFSASYHYTFGCPHCGTKNKSIYDLRKLPMNSAKDGLTEPFFADLPDAGVRVGLRFLRGKDEAAIMRESQRVRMQSSDAPDRSHALRLGLQLVTVGDKPAPTEPLVLADMVNNFTMLDSEAIAEATDENEPGIDLSMSSECSACGMTSAMILPLNLGFFRSSRN